MTNYQKLKEEIKQNGITSALKKSLQYLSYKTEKIHINNVLDSFRVAMSDNNIIVHFFTSVDNFGDSLNPILIKQMFGKNAYEARKIINIKNKPIYTAIGSCLQNLNYNNLEIWGSGFLYDDENRLLKRAPKKIHAVRGPLTRKLLIKQGFPCPEIYGDPGLLVPKIYTPVVEKKYNLGIIPHYNDKNSGIIKHLISKYTDNILIIDIQSDWKQVIDNINKCELIASSSLHGIITADAYNIPSLWIKLSNNVPGGDFKFQDYALSVNRDQMEPFFLSEDTTLLEIINAFKDYKIKIDLDKLINSCPFKD